MGDRTAAMRMNEGKGDRIQIWENGLRNAPNDPDGTARPMFVSEGCSVYLKGIEHRSFSYFSYNLTQGLNIHIV